MSRRTVQALGRHVGKVLAALLQERDRHFHAVVCRLLQQQRQYLQGDNLVRL